VRSAFFWDITQHRMGNPLSMLQDNVSVPSSRLKKSKENHLLGLLDPWKM
jgi:hypothetical protein